MEKDKFDMIWFIVLFTLAILILIAGIYKEYLQFAAMIKYLRS